MYSASRQYIRKVNRQLRCPMSIKKPFLRQLENEASRFCSRYSDANGAMLSQQFGTPEEVAKEFLSELGEQAVNRCTYTRNKLLRLTAGVILAAVILVMLIGTRTDLLKHMLPAKEFVVSISYDEESEGSSSRIPLQDTIWGNQANTETTP